MIVGSEEREDMVPPFYEPPGQVAGGSWNAGSVGVDEADAAQPARRQHTDLAQRGAGGAHRHRSAVTASGQLPGSRRSAVSNRAGSCRCLAAGELQRALGIVVGQIFQRVVDDVTRNAAARANGPERCAPVPSLGPGGDQQRGGCGRRDTNGAGTRRGILDRVTVESFSRRTDRASATDSCWRAACAPARPRHADGSRPDPPRSDPVSSDHRASPTTTACAGAPPAQVNPWRERERPRPPTAG